ncbi:MAG TPA: DNA repair protein RadC [Alphaproteobacteria bacterium]|nr:DNA repair protein RadC [Alphaproteobacteria bacterium]
MVDGASGHRQRLKDKFAAGQGVGLQDYELLELLLTYAIPRRDVKPLAKTLLVRFGSLTGVLQAEAGELAGIKGLGPATTTLMTLIGALSRRVTRAALSDQPVLDNRLALLDYLYSLFAGKGREEVHVLYLDGRHKLLRDETLFTGTLDNAAASPREILKHCLELKASGLVIAHNHPSGAPKPSAADRIFTAGLLEAAALLEVTLHDHVIVGVDEHFSFKGAGLL